MRHGTGAVGAAILAACLKTSLYLLGKFNEGNILFVAHNGVNRFYLSYKLGMIVKDY
ncbi:MAG: hypothetical protein WKF91_10415 [Segetibacter sp.]